MKSSSLFGLVEFALVGALSYCAVQGCHKLANTMSYIKNQEERTRILEHYDQEIPKFDGTNNKDVVRESKRLAAQYQEELNKKAMNLRRLDQSL